MLIRQAVAADARAVADIYLAARETALPRVAWAHDGPEVRGWIAQTLIPAVGVHVAEEDGVLLGFIALHADWVNQLNIHPDHWRRGVGSALIEFAKTLHPDGLRLWCFQVNTAARAFYERHGFEVMQTTDGHGNEEHEPEMLYAWNITVTA